MKKLVLFAALASTVGCANLPKIDPNQALQSLVQAAATTSQVLDAVQTQADKAAVTANTAVNVADQLQQAAQKVKDLPQTLEAQADAAVLNPLDSVHVVAVKGDSLWNLSRIHYGTGFLWPLACVQNGMSNCGKIQVGQQLRFATGAKLATYNADVLAHYKLAAYSALAK